MITITPRLDIDAEGKYCEHCRWMEQCPPGCRIFRQSLQRCLGGGTLRCAACLEAEHSSAAGWQPIETAPKTGEHILAGIFGAGCGFGGPNWQAHCMVVHYWSNPGEEGFYPSNGPDETYPATHWRPLDADQRPKETK